MSIVYKDFLGRPLEIGDSVVAMAPGYRHFVLARVVAFTPKNVRVGYQNTWNYRSGMYMELLQDSNQLVRVDGPDLTAYLMQK